MALRTIDDLTDLRSLVLVRKCVAFVGAGMANPPGLDWKDLVNRLAIECGIKLPEPIDNIHPRDFPKWIDRCIQKEAKKCDDVLRRDFPRHTATTRTAINYILNLRFPAILTTNFDPWIRQNSRNAEYNGVYVYPHFPTYQGITGGIYYLHGIFDSSDSSSSITELVLGEKSFTKAYSNSLLLGLLVNVLIYHNVFFIGFNPLEDHFVAVLKSANKIR